MLSLYTYVQSRLPKGDAGETGWGFIGVLAVVTCIAGYFWTKKG